MERSYKFLLTNARFLYSICISKYNWNSPWKESIRPFSSALRIWYFSQGNFTNGKHSIIIYILKVFEVNLKNVCQKAIKKPSQHLLAVYFAFLTNVWMFRYHVVKIAYYNILRFYCFKKSLQSVLKTWQVLKSKKKFYSPNFEIPFFVISNPDFSLFFQ